MKEMAAAAADERKSSSARSHKQVFAAAISIYMGLLHRRKEVVKRGLDYVLDGTFLDANPRTTRWNHRRKHKTTTHPFSCNSQPDSCNHQYSLLSFLTASRIEQRISGLSYEGYMIVLSRFMLQGVQSLGAVGESIPRSG